MKYYCVPQILKDTGDPHGFMAWVPDCDEEHVLIHQFPDVENGAIIGCDTKPAKGELLDTGDKKIRDVVVTNGGIV